MGLEPVEVTMALEQHFGIKIAEHEGWVFHSTPADIVWMVQEKLAGRDIPEHSLDAWKRLVDILEAGPGYEATGWFRRLFNAQRIQAAIQPLLLERYWRYLSSTLHVELPPLEEQPDGTVIVPRRVATQSLLLWWLLRHAPDSLQAQPCGSPNQWPKPEIEAGPADRSRRAADALRQPSRSSKSSNNSCAKSAGRPRMKSNSTHF